MPGLNASLNIGLSGLLANQSALNVVGHNIVNVNTAGYTRQTVQFTATSPQSLENMSFGTGVKVSNVFGTRNQYLDLQITQTIARQKSAEVRYQDLQAVTATFTEDGTNGLGSQIQGLFQGFKDLASRPEDASVRASLVGKAQVLVDGLQSRYQTLTDQRATEDKTIANSVSSVNTLASQIAALNDRIAGESVPGADNDARDQRKNLTDQLAAIVGIQVSEDKNGIETVSLDAGSAVLVTGSTAYTMSTETDPANDYQQKVMLRQGEAAAPINVTPFIKEGTMGGALELRDKAIPSFQRQLDQLAAGLTQGVNQLHAAGFGLNGTTGVDFFQGIGANVGGLPTGITAASGYHGLVNQLSVNAAVAKDPSLIAAAGAAGLSGDNAVANAIGKLQTASGTVDTNGDGVGDSGPFSAVVGSIVANLGSVTQGYQSRQDTQDNLLTALQNQRDSASAVNLDEEATNLLTYQRGYQASARFVTVISQLTDQLINSMGR